MPGTGLTLQGLVSAKLACLPTAFLACFSLIQLLMLGSCTSVLVWGFVCALCGFFWGREEEGVGCLFI